MQPSSILILIVEDDAVDAENIKRSARNVVGLDYACSMKAAHEKLRSGDYDGICTDLNLGDSSGTDTVVELLKYDLPILVITSATASEMLRQIIDMGVSGIIPKAAPNDEIQQRLVVFSELVAQRKQERFLKAAQDSIASRLKSLRWSQV